jgi:hypothetical protein
MVFTHCTPSCIPAEAVLARTLQICSIKVAKIKHLNWPFDVYGLVAARDYVDFKRNILFYRPRSQSQTLTKNVPFSLLILYYILLFLLLLPVFD